MVNGTIKKKIELQSIPPLHHSMNLTAKFATQTLLNDAMEGRNVSSELNALSKPACSCITGVPSVKVKSAFPFVAQTSQNSS